MREWSPGSLLNSPFSNGEKQGKTAWDVDEWKSITDEIQVAGLSSSKCEKKCTEIYSKSHQNSMDGASKLSHRV